MYILINVFVFSSYSSRSPASAIIDSTLAPVPEPYRTTTTARRARSHYPDDSPSFYRRDLQGGLNRAPVSGHSMEFLRGIYAFMQVSRSSVSLVIYSHCHEIAID